MKFEPLTDGDVLLRSFDKTDAIAFTEAVLESLETVGKYMPWAVSDYSQESALSWFQLCEKSSDSEEAFEFGIFSKGTGRLLGGCGLNQFNKGHNFCNLGYWVRQSAQGQGIATGASRLLLALAFEKLKLTRVEIILVESNVASEAVAKKVGAEFERISRNRLVFPKGPVAAKVYAKFP
jgi:ribosomal-protein-serine acetyltransferase